MVPYSWNQDSACVSEETCALTGDAMFTAHLRAAVVMFRRTILSRASLYTALVMTLGFHTRLDLQHNFCTVISPPSGAASGILFMLMAALIRTLPVSAIFTDFIPREPHPSCKQASPRPFKDLASSLCGSRHIAGNFTFNNTQTSPSGRAWILRWLACAPEQRDNSECLRREATSQLIQGTV